MTISDFYCEQMSGLHQGKREYNKFLQTLTINIFLKTKNDDKKQKLTISAAAGLSGFLSG